NKNKATPTNKTKYKQQNIGQWLQTQKKKINKATDDVYIKLSENKYVKENLDEYLDPTKKWNEWKDLLFEYCNKNKATPTWRTKYKQQNISTWLQDQKSKINNATDDV